MIKPLITIIIPTFNCEKTLDAALSSVVKQTFSNYDVVLIDGKSTDNTLAIGSGYSQRYENISILSEKDKGVYDAMNKGIAKAGGEWLLFLGSDDQLYDNKVLESVSKKLLATNSKFVYGNVEVVGDGLWAKDGNIYDGMFDLTKLFQKNICHQSIFYHNSLFENLGNYNIQYAICADWDFNHRCYSQNRAEYIDIIVARFQSGGHSTIQQVDRYTGYDCIINLRNYYSISYYNKLFSTYSWVFYTHAKTAWYSKKPGSALNYFILSFWHARDKMLLMKTSIKDVLNHFKGQQGNSLKFK